MPLGEKRSYERLGEKGAPLVKNVILPLLARVT